MEAGGELGTALAQLREFGVDKLFEDAEFRAACVEALKQAGCPAMVAGWGVEAIFSTCKFCIETVEEQAKETLKGFTPFLIEGGKAKFARLSLRLLESTPFIRGLLKRLVGVAGKISDEHKLKEQLIRNLRGEATAIAVPIDMTTSGEIVRFLFELREHEKLLATLDETIATPLRAIGEKLDAYFKDFYAPTLEDPRELGGVLAKNPSPTESLVAKVERDAFQGRVQDLAFLHGFLDCADPSEPLQQFRWALLTGPGGQGKTRLAIQFLAQAEARGFRAGFVPNGEAPDAKPLHWAPPMPTLIVIDYPAQHPVEVGKLLRGFASAAARGTPSRPYPVRVLLLERDAEGEWFKTMAPRTSGGDDTRKFAFGDAGWPDHPLRPLAREDLIAIMRGRMPGVAIGNDPLYDALLRVDEHHESVDGKDEIAPRPLFAAAVARVLAESASPGRDVSAVAAGLKREQVLGWLIERQRKAYWGDPHPGEHEKRRLEKHENLLVVATIALNVDRERLEDAHWDFVRGRLPSDDEIDVDRYRRMAGGDPRHEFARLEPDILGEFFVLDRLRGMRATERQALIDAGLGLGGDSAAVFLTRCAVDFAAEWAGLGYLRPSRGLTAFRAFAWAAADQTASMDGAHIETIKAIAAIAAELADGIEDADLHRLAAMALLNKGVRLGALGRPEEELAVYDAIEARYGAAIEAGIREQAAKALFNKGFRLGALGRPEEELAVYDAIEARYGAAIEAGIRELAAKALFGKGVTLGALGRSEEELAVYDAIEARYGAAIEAGIREQVASALVNKGVTLGALGRPEAALAVYDAIEARYGAAIEAGIREQAAKALVNKGFTLGALGRPEEELAVYDAIEARYGAAIEAGIRQQAATALFYKGVTLGALGRPEEELAVYDAIEARYGAAIEAGIRELAATALFNKGFRLWALGRPEEALAVYDAIEARYGAAIEAGIREKVAKALFNKGFTLGALGRPEEAITVYEEIVARYRAASEVALQDIVGRAKSAIARLKG